MSLSDEYVISRAKAQKDLKDFLETLKEDAPRDAVISVQSSDLQTSLGTLLDELNHLPKNYQTDLGGEFWFNLRHISELNIKNLVPEAKKNIYYILKRELEFGISALSRFFKTTPQDKIPFIAYSAFLLVLIPSVRVEMAAIAALIGIITTFICKQKEDKKYTKDLWGKKKELEVMKKTLKETIDELEKDKPELQDLEENLDKQNNKSIKSKINKIKSEDPSSFAYYLSYRFISNTVENFSKEIYGKKPRSSSKSQQFLVFGAMYGLIGAIAMTAMLENFEIAGCNDLKPNDVKLSDLPTGDLNPNDRIRCFHGTKILENFFVFIYSTQMLIIASFFAVAIIFYHCGILFFSSEATGLVVDKKLSILVASSFLIFLEAIVLYFAAVQANSLLQFALWIFLLLIIDIAWIVINLTKKVDMLFQWIHLDSMMFGFLLVLMLTRISHPNSVVGLDYLLTLVVFCTRTVLDYKMGWKSFWGRFDISESSLSK